MIHGQLGNGSISSTNPLFPDAMQGMRDAWEQLKEMRNREEETNQSAAFLQQGFALAWKEGIHTDILIKPGTGPQFRPTKPSW